MLPEKNISKNINTTCPECKAYLKLEVLGSSAGYYIGTMCRCGPCSRESPYYLNAEQAQKALDSGKFKIFKMC